MIRVAFAAVLACAAPLILAAHHLLTTATDALAGAL